MKKTPIEELNKREQRVYQVLKDGAPHTIGELKRLFTREAKRHLTDAGGKVTPRDVDRQAQSFVRNSLRKLVRLGLAKGSGQDSKLPKGTYKAARVTRLAAKKVSVAGLNTKEQRLFKALVDGEPHAIGELKRLFTREAKQHLRATNGRSTRQDVDRQAQSFVRNSLRRLVKDGLVEGSAQNARIPRGTYRLSRSGKAKIKRA
jgi:chromosome condensin MukBEF MukE localization factor